MIRLALAAVLASIALPLAAGQEKPAADDIARRVQDRDTGRDSRAAMRMKLYDRQNRARERALTLTSLRGRGNPGTPATAPDGDRLLIRFTYPNDIRGTGFLVLEHTKGEDERFLYLPSLGRVRRIAGSEAQESFVGSDFTYEDIGGREFDEYSYQILDENASWTPPALGAGASAKAASGPAYPAWRLESRRKDQSARFPRVVSLVVKPGQNAPGYMVVAADIHNRRDEKQKVYTVRRVEQVEGIWTAMDAEMTNALEESRTELTIEKMDYNAGLKEADFTRRELESGIR